jgi:predicted nucleic acid-binding protein
VALVVDASVALKWVLPEPDSYLAQAVAEGNEELLVPYFWLNEACNICWVQVRKGKWTPDEASEGLVLLRAQVPPTPTGTSICTMSCSTSALAVNHSTYDTLYVAFAVAMGARGVVTADGPFVRDMQRHPDPALASLLIPLETWARQQGLT